MSVSVTDRKSIFDVAVAPPFGLPGVSLFPLRSGSAPPFAAATGPGLEGVQWQRAKGVGREHS